MTYNYYEAMENDIREAINDNYSKAEVKTLLDDREDFEERLNDEMWADDSVTGNGSGSYTFNSLQARDYVLDNMDLLKEAYTEFCQTEKIGDLFINENYEAMDVTIRCCLLHSCIDDVLDGLKDEMKEGSAEGIR